MSKIFRINMNYNDVFRILGFYNDIYLKDPNEIWRGCF
jgi:hypothetical protein